MIKGKNGAKFKGPSDTKRRLQSADEVKGTQKPQQPAAGTPAAAIEQNAKPIPPTSSYNPPQDPNKTYGKVMVSGNTWAQNFADKNGQNGDVRTGYITPQAAPGNDVGNNAEEAVTAQQTGVQAPAAPAKAANPTGTALATALVKPTPSIKDQLLSYQGLSKGVAVGSKDYSQMTQMGSGNPRGISFNLPGMQKNQFIGAGGELFADRGKALDSRMNARVAEARNELKQVSIMGPRWQRYGETNSFDPRSILQHQGKARGNKPPVIPGAAAIPDVPTETKALAGGGTTGIIVGKYDDYFNV